MKNLVKGHTHMTFALRGEGGPKAFKSTDRLSESDFDKGWVVENPKN